jgi:hypothetical protein
MPKSSKAGLADNLVVTTLSRIDEKLDKVDSRLDEHSTIMVRQQAILEEHMRRSDLLEKKIDKETATIKDEMPKVVDDQIRLARNKFLINALKAAGVLAGLGGAGVGAKQLIEATLKLWGS